MATAKKPATTKPAAKKTPVKKAPVAKKPAAKKVVTKKAPAKAASAYNSFKPSTDVSTFTNFKVTRQTIYWVVLIAFIIFAQLWILKLQIDVATLLDSQQLELMSE